MFKHIVVAFITPKIKIKSFYVGLGLAKKFNSDLVVVDCIYKSPPTFHFFETKADKQAAKKRKEQAKESMSKFEKLAEEAGVKVSTKIAFTENITDWVVDYVATNRTDLLIMDHPHLSEFEEPFYEDIIHGILHNSHLPVLTLR